MNLKTKTERKTEWMVVIMELITALICVAFLYLAFGKKCLGPITVFHIAGELFSIIICQVIAYSLSRATDRNRVREIVGESRGFRIYRTVCFVFVLLMMIDALVWMAFGWIAEGTRYWMTVWYLIPMAAMMLAFAGIFRWMMRRSGKLEDSFRHLMSETVAAEVQKEDGGEGRTAYVTVLFCQIRGADPSVRDVDGDALHRLLRQFYSETSGICERYGGTALEFPGYCVMCVFGAPGELKDHETAAVTAALEITAEMQSLRELEKETGFPAFDIRIGINTGNAHVGNVGSGRQKRFTVIGSSVNLASRIGGYAGPGEILISENVRRAVDGFVTAEEVGRVMPKGFDEPLCVYRVNRNGGVR